MKLLRWLTVLSVAAGILAAAEESNPGIYGVYGEAGGFSYSIAPGSNFLIFSGRLAVGPATPKLAKGFPLVTNLSGTSVRVTIGSLSVSVYILATETTWVRALLPSATPLGDGLLTVSYNGATSVPYRITVVKRHFGIYDGAVCGSSTPPSFCVPRAVQNVRPTGDVSNNSLLQSARPEQFVTLWGTGLGIAPGDEVNGPIPGNLQIPGLEVLVGNRPARILYSGRSGCCAGMDEIVFEVPREVQGCNVPVFVRFSQDGLATPDILISIASASDVCSDPQGLSESEVRALAAGNLSAAELAVTGDTWLATFAVASETGVIPPGTCRGFGGGFIVGLRPGSLKDAGPALDLGTPRGNFLARRTEEVTYTGPFESPIAPGEYRIDNGNGGPGVGPFRAQFSIPAQNFTWTNREQVANQVSAEGLTVSWSGADPDNGHVEVYGVLANDGETQGSSVFECSERGDKGTFTIPATILQRASPGLTGVNEFHLTLAYRFSKRITIPGIDFAEFLFNDADKQTLDPGILRQAGVQ